VGIHEKKKERTVLQKGGWRLRGGEDRPQEGIGAGEFVVLKNTPWEKKQRTAHVKRAARKTKFGTQKS